MLRISAKCLLLVLVQLGSTGVLLDLQHAAGSQDFTQLKMITWASSRSKQCTCHKAIAQAFLCLWRLPYLQPA